MLEVGETAVALELRVERRGEPLEQRRDGCPEGEFVVEPEEIASLVAYLASPVASATNGAALRADGGVLTGIL